MSLLVDAAFFVDGQRGTTVVAAFAREHFTCGLFGSRKGD
ncbi:MAG: hypothetical protein OZSIB_3986 [Candidatus Ozemobacter sibiricus]|uniref:Uncharacterized protein n=1 Tax=Candidatus Ozemobacter sibiricus TaxID=2268124 RepID=A0A367ZR49_9BACT|nr:MAG: hypothetical protein OZSIB_3986 [Candidatus Ozemobacter sibiricus]